MVAGSENDISRKWEWCQQMVECCQEEVRMFSAESEKAVSRKWKCCQQELRKWCQQEVRMLSAGSENACSRRSVKMMSAWIVNALSKNWAMSARSYSSQLEVRMLSAGNENAVSRKWECCQQEMRMLSAGNENAVNRKWESGWHDVKCCHQDWEPVQKEVCLRWDAPKRESYEICGWRQLMEDGGGESLVVLYTILKYNIVVSLRFSLYCVNGKHETY